MLDLAQNFRTCAVWTIVAHETGLTHQIAFTWENFIPLETDLTLQGTDLTLPALYQSSNVYPARSLVQPQRGKIPVKLVNPGLHAITLEPNTKIGEVMSITYSATTSLISQNNSSIVNNISLPRDYLSDKQQVQLRNVLNKYTDVFAQSDSDLGRTNILEHTVDTQGHTPISQQPYRVPEAQGEVIKTHIRDMAQRGNY